LFLIEFSQEWLDLSIQKNIPISLLIMSRAFAITSSFYKTEEGLRSSMSSFDSDTINEVVLNAANMTEENTFELRKRKLESLQFQEEVID
jgi:LETM1 and EF-hand domain-containing protein 1